DYFPLAAVFLFSAADDDDEFRFARHAGHVSNVIKAGLAFQPPKSGGHHRVHNDLGNHLWNIVLAGVRSVLSTPLDDRRALMRDFSDSALVFVARTRIAVNRWRPDAVYGARRLGDYSGAPVRTFA